MTPEQTEAFRKWDLELAALRQAEQAVKDAKERARAARDAFCEISVRAFNEQNATPPAKL